MSRKKIDMIGRRFNMLTVIEEAGKTNYSQLLYKVVCDCGNVLVRNGIRLRQGSYESCGECKYKRCNECKELKLHSEYYAHKKSKDKLRYSCKKCQSKETYISSVGKTNIYLDLKREILEASKSEKEKLTDIIYKVAGLTQANGHNAEYDELKDLAYFKIGL